MTLEDVISYLEAWIKEKRTGSIQVNYFKGGISNLNLSQCVKTETIGECKAKFDK